jgi:hypothetical protein
MILVALSRAPFDHIRLGLSGFDNIIGFFLFGFGGAVYLVAVEEISRRGANDERQNIYQN